MKQLRTIYKEVRQHLLSQGRKSMSPCGSSRYRGIGGMKCSVGALIKEEHYHSSLEDYSALALSVCKALHASGVNMERPKIRRLVYRLQVLHDTIPTPLWKEGLDDLAKEFGIVV